MRRTLTLLLSLAVLWAIVGQLNHALSGWQVYLWVGGLFVTFAALSQPLRSGLPASFLGGLLLDAHLPVSFGIHALLFAAAHAFLFHIRDRVPRDETATRLIIALFANLALFLVFSFFHIGAVPTPAKVWPRIIVDLLSSQVFIALAAPWFFAFQTQLLQLGDHLAATYHRRFR